MIDRKAQNKVVLKTLGVSGVSLPKVKRRTGDTTPTMNDIPHDPKHIKGRIRSYERKFREDKAYHGGNIDDGAGKRFLHAPLYLFLDDLEGALKAFAWYEREFPDDSPDAGHLLCWALALHRAGEGKAAAEKLKQAMLANFLILPRLLSLPDPAPDLYDRQGWGEHQEVTWVPRRFYELWTPQDIHWAETKYRSDEFQATLKRHLEIERELKTTGVGTRRSDLIEEQSALMYGAGKARALRAEVDAMWDDDDE